MAIFGVRVEGRHQFESMASVLALLAYPAATRARIEFERSAIYQFARDIAKVRPMWGSSVHILANDLPSVDPDGKAKVGYRILEHDRLMAGDIATGYAVRAAGKIALLGNRKFGVGSAIAVATAQGAFKSSATGYTYWKASQPVVHLAAAYKLLRRSCRSESIYELLELADGAKKMIETAANIKVLLLSLVGPKSGPGAIPDFRGFRMIDIDSL